MEFLELADMQRVPQCFQGIPHRNEFVPNVPIVARLPDRCYHCRIVDFLSFVKVISTGIARGVIMGKVLMVVLNCADQIALP